MATDDDDADADDTEDDMHTLVSQPAQSFMAVVEQVSIQSTNKKAAGARASSAKGRVPFHSSTLTAILRYSFGSVEP